MNKMNFGCNNVFWMEFVHNGQTFCIKFDIKSKCLISELFYSYLINDKNGIEKFTTYSLKQNKSFIMVRLDADTGTWQLYNNANNLIRDVERMYDIKFSQTFKNIALKVFCQEVHSAYLLNKESNT